MFGNERTAIIVAGMHRSGTSATTRIINLLGAAIAEDLIPAGIGNERGHWESRAVQNLNDEMLTAIGSDVYSPVNFSLASLDERLKEQWLGRMRNILAEEYASTSLFVLKDPRITLFLPLWLEALHQLAIAPRFVLPFRHPNVVADSLEVRERRLQSGNVLPQAQGKAVWLRYVLASEKFTRGQRRTFVAFDALLADWRREFARIGTQLQIDWPNWKTVESEIDDFLETKSQKTGLGNREYETADICRDVMSCLENAIDDPDSVNEAFDSVAKKVELAEEMLGAYVVSRERVINDLRTRAESVARHHDHERADMHAKFAVEIETRDSRLAEAIAHARQLAQSIENSEHAQKQRMASELVRESEQAEIHARTASEIAARDAQLGDMTIRIRHLEETAARLEREHRNASDYANSLLEDRDRAIAYANTLQESRDEAIEYALSLEQAKNHAQRAELLARDAMPIFFTIASRNYLAYALTLMQSVAEKYPDAPRYLILADRADGDPTLVDAPFTTISVDALALPNFEAFAFRYTIMEFNTAIKPYAFAHLRARHPNAGIVYLDPDILVVDTFVEVEAALAEGALAVLTPHLVKPVNDDHHPGERDILVSGTYNCGFVAIGPHPDADRLIQWWAERLEFGAFSDVAAGLFTDQKWVDLVPGLFPDVCILRDEGYNLAYWNLSQRPVSQHAGRWYAGKRPLAFVHFSGVDLQRPSQFSKHQNRHSQATIGKLRPLYKRYLELLAENGHAEHRLKPYAFGAFADGEPISDPVRAVYRRYFDKGAEKPQSRPFSMDRRLFDYPCDELPERADAPISRVMYAAWAMREDLRRAFDLNEPEGRLGFVRWFVRTAGAEMHVPERHIAAVHRTLSAEYRVEHVQDPGFSFLRSAGSACLDLIAWSCRYRFALRIYAIIPERSRNRIRHRLESLAFREQPLSDVPSSPSVDAFGVNLVGYAHGEFGVAEILRRHAQTLHSGQVPFVVHNFDTGVAARQNDRSMQAFVEDTCTYSVNLFCINADQMSVARKQLGDTFFADRYNIGLWFWELEKFPTEWFGAIDLVDEIWVASAFVHDAIAACTEKPVHIVPVALNVNLPEGISRSDFGLADDAFVCLVSFDFNSFVVRKNAEAAIAAFRRAFDESRRDVRLVIKTTNGDRFNDALGKLIDFASADDRIEVRDGFLDRQDMWALQACSDCYVSLHRSEGLGLGMAECMLLGKPVVATAYSGNLAFMDAENSCLVGYSLVPVAEGEYPAWQGQHWAQPNIDEAAAHLRKLADDPDFARALGEKAKASVELSLSAPASLSAMQARLKEIHALQRG